MFSKPPALGPLAVALAVLVFAAAAAAAANLTQKPGPIGCVTETSLSGQCEDGAGLVGPSALTISPDGRNVYSTDQSWDSIATLTRNPADGTLRPFQGSAGCLSSTSSHYPECTEARVLDGASDLAISPDGKNVYVAAPDSNAVAVLDRDPEDGHLTQSSGEDGCVAPGSVGGCEEGRCDRRSDLGRRQPRRRQRLRRLRGARGRHRGLRSRPGNGRPQPGSGRRGMRQRDRRRIAKTG